MTDLDTSRSTGPSHDAFGKTWGVMPSVPVDQVRRPSWIRATRRNPDAQHDWRELERIAADLRALTGLSVDAEGLRRSLKRLGALARSAPDELAVHRTLLREDGPVLVLSAANTVSMHDAVLAATVSVESGT